MAINLFGLNATEVVLTRPETNPEPVYRVDKDKFKENWENIKNNSENLLQVSQNVLVSIEGIKSTGEVKRNDCNYSLEAFFRKDMPRVMTDGGFLVGGAKFSEEELEQCRMVMKTAVDGIGCGIGKNTNIDYRNYAQMGIAVSSVKSYANENLTKEQAEVVNKAMQEYNEALINMEKEMLSGQRYIDSDQGAMSEYYGKVEILDDAAIDSINRMKGEIGKITGQQFAPTQSGITARMMSATNQKLISEITDLFSNMDSKDEKSVQAVMAKYKELVKPAYIASGMNDRYGSLARILNTDVADFRKQLSSILLAANYHTTDYRI